MQLQVQSEEPRQVIDITELVTGQIRSGVSLAYVFVAHTTAAITTADLDPGTDLDLLDALLSMLPARQWRHPHNPEHAPAHLLSSIVGPGVAVPVHSDQLALGSWQRIVMIELDGPRERTVEVTLV